MPDFLVSAATGALSPVLHKLAALLGDEYKRFKGVRGEVKFLIRELEAMHAFLLKKSEEENPDAQDKAWMKEVRELSYDIEDSLDDFRVRVDDDSTKPDGFIDKCKNLLDKTKARRRIAKEIEKLKGQVKEVSERNARYKQISNTVMNTSKVTIDPRALVIFEDASRLVGIDKPKQEVISFLMKDDGGVSLQQPKIVSIVGIGGIGKTTLANRVYEELKDQFECQVFLSVSRNPDISRILKTILIKVTGRGCYETDIQQLIMEIKDLLQTKRYFIVIDDIWDVETWDTIKYALSKNSHGSVIITTTRIHDVAKACSSLYSGWVFHPKPLQDDESKRLFQNRIFGLGNECPESLKEVSDKILKKCGGLPLAIIAISGLLANKTRNGVHTVTEWDQVQTSIGHGLERDSTVEGMMGILSLSYFDLPSHLKACLLYLSIFPEDFEIDKDRLVRLWVAEGFIPAESTCTLYESGEKAFNQLVNRNLIHPQKIKKWTGEVESCYLHDTILDFIVCKSTEENFVTVHGILTPPPGIKVRRLSVQYRITVEDVLFEETEGDLKLHLNHNYANVRSIISFLYPCSFLGFRFLRVLDFTGCHELENHHLANIGELLQLRYLSLRHTRITELPEQIGALQYLETLDLRVHEFQLPTAIVRLKRLVHLLIVSPCFPRGIKNMQALEDLHFVCVDDIKAAAICVEEIGHLTKMRHLTFYFSSDFIDKESYEDFLKKMVSSFQRLKKLQTLFLMLGGKAEHDVIFNGYDIILEVPWCSASLRKLVLKMNPMRRLPSWIKSLVNIEQLVLRICKLDQESLYILGDLPVLVDLDLRIVNKVEDTLSTDKQLLISNRYPYRSLRHFSAGALGPFSAGIINTMLTFEAGSMPKLEELRITFNADITISVTNGRLDFGLKHLSQLTEAMCFMFGTRLNIFLVEAAIQEELDNHPKFPKFLKYRLPLTTALAALPTDLSFTMHHHGASPDIGRRHGKRQRRPKARHGATIRGRELLQGALHIPDRVKGTSGAAPSTSDVLGPRLIAAPQQQEVFVPLCFTFSSGSTPNAEAERHVMDCYKPSQLDGLANAFSSAFNSLSLSDGHPGPSATAVEVSSSDTGAAPVTSDVLGPQLIPAPQQQEAFVPPCFTFSSGLSPNAEADYGLPLPEDLANAFTSTFSGLSLRDDHPGSSVTALEASSSDMSGAASAPSDVLGPPLIAAPQQQGAFVPPCFTFSSESPPDAEAEEQATDCYKPSRHDSLLANAFNGFSVRNDQPGSISSKNQPGSSATAVEAASSDTGTQTNGPYGRRILVPRRRSSGRTAK